MQVNEISWNKEGDQFFLTNGNGCVVILRFVSAHLLPDLTMNKGLDTNTSGTCMRVGSLHL